MHEVGVCYVGANGFREHREISASISRSNFLLIGLTLLHLQRLLT